MGERRRLKTLQRVYIDTNIFDYVALKHPKYGQSCKKILDDVLEGKIEAYCSQLVPIEILGSLAKIDAEIAAGAVKAFYSFPINHIIVTENIMIEAIDIIQDTGITYDAVHAAAMKTQNINTVITEDVNHWSRIKGISIIRPLEYT